MGASTVNWRYVAVDPHTGSRTEGQMRAGSERAVISHLEGMGLLVGPVTRAVGLDQYLAQLKGLAQPGGGPKVATADLAMVTKQMEVLLRSGLSPADALVAAVDAAPNPRFAQLLQELADRVRQGETLAQAMEGYRTFSESYKAWIASAEQTGRLDKAMGDLYEQLHQQAKTEANMKAATIYPKMSLALSLLLAFAMVRWLVPQFSAMLASFGDELPAITKVLVALNERIGFVVAAVVGVWVAIRVVRQRLANDLERGAQIERLLYRLPVLGVLLRRQMLFRWASTMAGLVEAGVHLPPALQIAGRASGSRWVRRDTPELIRQVTDGRPLSDAARNAMPALSDMVVGLIATGEKTGKTPQMMQTAASAEAQQIDASVQNLSKRVEMVSMVAVIGVVGVVVAALWIPILQLSASAATSL